MKTMNVIKKVFISAIVLTMVMGFAFGFNVIVKAAPEIGFIDGLNIEGAGIRTNGNQGMRFKVTIDSSVDKTDITKYGVAIAYGLVEDPSKFYYNQKVNGKDIISGSVTQLDGDNCYYITLYNIPQTGYMQNISVRAYYGNMYGYAYGNDIKVYNLATIAYKAMNDGITSSLLTDVDTYMNANYKKVYVDEFDNLVFDGFKETNPKVLKEQFINDINQYTNTTLTTDSIIVDWASQLQNDTTITDSKIYQAYNNTKFNNKWSWLLTYLTSKNNSSVTREINELNSNNPTLSALGFITLISSLYNFFNFDGVNTWEGILFNTESSYADLTTSNIYPEIEDYDIRKVGTSSALGHKIDITGYTCNWLLNDTTYASTTDYTVPSSNVKFTFNKICHVTYTISNNQVTITGLKVAVSNLVILSEYEGYPVIKLSDEAFRYCTSLTSITIQTGLTTIGKYVFFNCTNLASISFPSTLTTIEAEMFSSCATLTSITVDPNNTVFDSRNNCNALIYTATNSLVLGCKNTVIPNTINRIRTGSFYNCTALTTIIIPNSVTIIEENAFYGCTSVTIYCEATSKPSGWVSNWNGSGRPVYWGYTGN